MAHVIVFSSEPYDQRFLAPAAARAGHTLHFQEARLNRDTMKLAEGYPVVCAFVHDHLDADVLRRLHESGTRHVALRSAGFNNVDLTVAAAVGIRITRVPAYSPHAVAEHAVALILALNRKIYRAYPRAREGNFSLNGLLGFDLYDKTVGIVGTGKIGTVFAQIMHGFGCRLLAYDLYPNETCRALGVEYTDMDRLLAEADIISLHCPLTPETRHLVKAGSIEKMKKGVMLINTSRGEVVDTRALIEGLKAEHIGYVGLDVYEEEEGVFFRDHSDHVIQDDILSRLQTFPNVVITGHQAFFTREALTAIAETTIRNITDVEQGRTSPNEVTAEVSRS